MILFSLQTVASSWSPGLSISKEVSWPSTGNACVLDIAAVDVNRPCLAGCGVSFFANEYCSVYGLQSALVMAYSRDEFSGIQCGGTCIANVGRGVQVGIVTICDKPRWAGQLGLLNVGHIQFMNDAGMAVEKENRRVQVGMFNSSEGGVQAGVVNIGGSIQIGLFNASRSGLKIGLLNYGTWITPLVGW